jgi:hypothetical protein
MKGKCWRREFSVGNKQFAKTGNCELPTPEEPPCAGITLIRFYGFDLSLSSTLGGGKAPRKR